MAQRTAWPALASLDRRFSAEFRGDQLANLFPEDSARVLIRRGILADVGLAWTVGHCICEHHHDECAVRVDVEDGVYWGYCNEAGRRIEVSPDLLQRYRFDWKPWAAMLRKKNGLDGPGPILGTGMLFVGNGTVGGRSFGLVIVAPGCRRAADVMVPEGVRESGRPLVALAIGEPLETLPFDATIPAEALGEDLETIDTDVIERALRDVPQVFAARGEAKCVQFSHESPKGRVIDVVEYEQLRQRDVLSTYEVFIDRLRSQAWRNGRACTVVKNADGRAGKKRIGSRAINLIADYVQRPGIPMVAHATPTYRGAAVDPRSASTLLATARRSMHMKSCIRSGDRAREPGETMYVFEPGGMTWCVLARPPAP